MASLKTYSRCLCVGALLCGDMLSDSSASDTVVYTGGADGGVAKWSVFSNTEMSTE